MYFWPRALTCSWMLACVYKLLGQAVSLRITPIATAAVMTYKLFTQRDLLELHLVHACLGRRSERRRCEQNRRFHNDDE